VDQEAYEHWMNLTRSKMLENNVPEEVIAEFDRQHNGGKCPECGAVYREANAQTPDDLYTVDADEKKHTPKFQYQFAYYLPSCSCIERRESAEKHEAIIRGQMSKAGVPFNYTGAKFEDWITDGVSDEVRYGFDVALNYATDGEAAEGQGLILYGSVGTGKTMLGCCVLREAIKTGKMAVRFERMSDIVNELITQEDGKNWTKRVKDYDLIMFDDVDKLTTTSEWVRSQIYSTFDVLTSEGKGVLLTSNFLTTTDFYEKFGDAVFSRLAQCCHLVKMKGDDFRIRLRDQK